MPPDTFVPLREVLHTRLRVRFGEVAVARPGEQMTSSYSQSMDQVDSRGRPRMDLEVESPGETYRVSCPFCGDTRRRLWINYLFGYWDPKVRTKHVHLCHCFNDGCPLQGNMSYKWRLYHMVFDDVSVDELGIPDVVKEGVKYTPAGPPGPPGLLQALCRLGESHPAVRYVRGRGYDPAALSALYKVCYCLEGYPQYPVTTGRLAIPIYMRGELAGWQARLLGKPSSRYVPKYYTMPHMRRGHVLYNHDAARAYAHVVVVEGVTDVWRYGPEAVALLGNKPTQVQAQLLLGSWWGGAIFCMLDGAARDENLALYDMLRGGPTPVIRVDLPADKDPDDCTTDYLRMLVAQAAVDSGVDLTSLTREADAD